MAADCSGWIEPLNLQCILVNTFAGSIELFVIIAVISIGALGAYFKMLNMTVLVMFSLFVIMMAQYMQGIYFFVVVIVGLISAFGVARIAKR